MHIVQVEHEAHCEHSTHLVNSKPDSGILIVQHGVPGQTTTHSLAEEKTHV